MCVRVGYCAQEAHHAVDELPMAEESGSADGHRKDAQAHQASGRAEDEHRQQV